jgi:hypothetical protein
LEVVRVPACANRRDVALEPQLKDLLEDRAAHGAVTTLIQLEVRYEAEDDGGDGVESIGAELAVSGSQEVGGDLAEHM